MLGSPLASPSRGFREARGEKYSQHEQWWQLGGDWVWVRNQDASPATLLLPAFTTSYQCLLIPGTLLLQLNSSLLDSSEES